MPKEKLRLEEVEPQDIFHFYKQFYLSHAFSLISNNYYIYAHTIAQASSQGAVMLLALVHSSSGKCLQKLTIS